MPYRHEWKHEISRCDYLILRQRLRAALKRDEHAGPEGEYRVRSLYFDDDRDTALREKIDGVNRREKFRIRSYNGCLTPIHLEKKSKINGLCEKRSADLTRPETEAILRGEIGWMARSRSALKVELYSKMRGRLLRPAVLVDYIREPFIFPAGNVRITLDRDIRTGLKCLDFFNPDLPTVPVGDIPALLEVKYDAFLPDFIVDLLQLPGRRAGAFSKYAACRSLD